MTPDMAVIRLLAIFQCKAHLCMDSTNGSQKSKM